MQSGWRVKELSSEKAKKHVAFDATPQWHVAGPGDRRLGKGLKNVGLCSETDPLFRLLRLSPSMQRNRREQLCPWIAVPCIALLAALFSGVVAGCGAPAAPLPPTLNLPQPVRDLAAHRTGDTVHLTFSVPQKTTDKLPVRGLMTVKLCRSLENGPCQPVGTEAIPAQAKSASMDDSLPPELSQGPPRLLTYRVSILNRAAKSEGDSVPAYAAAGAAPPQVTGLTATAQRNGIVLAWERTGTAGQPANEVRFNRTRISSLPSQPQPRESNTFMARKTPEEPAEQMLRVPETVSTAPLSTAGRFSAIDTTVHTGSTYRYTAQRFEQVTLDNHPLEIASAPSPLAQTDYRDVFPPPVPVGLVSAADSTANAIDLNWTPDVDPGLAGYLVYRRPVGSTQPPLPISPAGKPVSSSSWSDTTALPGQRYAYSVSAIDTSGNESQRSAEVEDQWNAVTPQP